MADPKVPAQPPGLRSAPPRPLPAEAAPSYRPAGATTPNPPPPEALVHGARSFSLKPGPGNPWPLFSTTFRSILLARKTIFLLALLLVPVFITIIVHNSPNGDLAGYGDFYREPNVDEFDPRTGQGARTGPVVPPDQSGGLLWFQDLSFGLLFPFLVPLTMAVFAGATIREEVDGKTLPYLFTRPIYRNWVVLPKTLAIMLSVYLLAALALTVFWFCSVALTENPFQHFNQLLGFYWVAALAILATGGLFTLLGTLMRRAAILIGVYLFIWETGLSNIPVGLIKKLSIVNYERAILYAITERKLDLFEQATGATSAVTGHVVLLLLGLGGLLAALYVVSNKDYNV